MPDSGRWIPGGGDPSLNEIARADRFFDALAAKQPAYPTDAAEARLANLLSDWRDDVRDVPVNSPIAEGDAIAALHGGLSGARRSRRSFAVVGSVAAAMLCLGGFGTAVYGAGPGDTLYGVRTAMFGQAAAPRDDQVALASAQLQEVQQLIDQGQWQQAQDKLVAVSGTVQDVDPTGSKAQLVDQWNALTYKVVEQDPAATLAPGEPLPALPSSPLTWLPVPVVQDPSGSTSTTLTTSDPSSTSVTSDSAVTSAVPPEVSMTTSPETTSPDVTSPSPSPSSTTVTSSTTTATNAPITTSSAPSTPPTTSTTSARPTTTTSAAAPTSSRAAEFSSPPAAQSTPPQVEPTPAQPRLLPTGPSAASPVEAPAPSAIAPVQSAPSAVVPIAPAQPSVATTTTVPPRVGG